jgi:nitroreductase
LKSGVWSYTPSPAKTTEVFALPENIVPVAMLPIGYPAENVIPAALHEQRHSLDEILLK